MLYGDVTGHNILWNEELQRAAIIDFNKPQPVHGQGSGRRRCKAIRLRRQAKRKEQRTVMVTITGPSKRPTMDGLNGGVERLSSLIDIVKKKWLVTI